MDGDALRKRIRDESETELSRLNSSKAVYALTNGEMTGETVRAGAARELRALSAALDEVADDVDGDDASALTDAADALAAAADDVDADGGRDVAPDDTALGTAVLEAAHPTAAAAGALLTLAAEGGQMVGFFVGNADVRAAEEFRELRSTLETHRDRLLECAVGADDGQTSLQAATDVVDAAYDEYVATLESMGIEPKDVC